MTKAAAVKSSKLQLLGYLLTVGAWAAGICGLQHWTVGYSS